MRLVTPVDAESLHSTPRLLQPSFLAYANHHAMLRGPQCFINGSVDEAIRDMRACPEHGGEVAFPKGMPPYPFGVDPVWHGTKSELPFLNSMKMKMSILLGVVHMNLGIMMSLFNNLYFRDRLSTICEFIPQVRVCYLLFVIRRGAG